jgi:hemoglobin
VTDTVVTPFDELGGREGVQRLAARFYEIMDTNENAAALRAMHGRSLEPMASKLASFLTGWLGGPRDYFENDETPCIMSVHRALPIGSEERDQWLVCMREALADCGVAPDLSERLDVAFARMAEAMRVV